MIESPMCEGWKTGNLGKFKEKNQKAREIEQYRTMRIIRALLTNFCDIHDSVH
jgi:hypothetical protein